MGRNVALWELARKRRLISKHPLSRPCTIAISPSGSELAVKNTSGECVVLDPTTLEVRRHLGGLEYGEGSGLVFTADGALVDASWNGDLLARDTTTGASIFHERERAMISQLSSGPDHLAFAYTYHPRGGEQTQVRLRRWPFASHSATTLIEEHQSISAIGLHGDRLAVISYGRLAIHSTTTGDVLAERAIRMTGTGWDLAWWPGGNRLLVAGGGEFALLDRGLEPLWSRESQYASTVAIRADGCYALLGAWDGVVVAAPA